MKRRVIIIVLDSVGIGELPDAASFGDKGCNTLGHIAATSKSLNLINLAALGIGNIIPIQNIEPVKTPSGCFGKMAEKSRGKDTTVGHWEIAGVITSTPFPVYPDGFPEDVIEKFKKAAGKEIIGNKPASGTKIIKELGEKHINTGALIVYTSADSVFQIAAHEEIVPPESLYLICKQAREILRGKHAVARVIARPFIGKPDNFTRTDRRRDFSLTCPQKTLLDHADEKGVKVLGIGKIWDIFNGRGIHKSIHIQNNADGCEKTINAINGNQDSGIIFTNLIDFDMKYGHRNDVEGYRKALEEFDIFLPEIENSLKKEDLLILTADHGNDPTTPGTDHTREYVPVLCYGKEIKKGISLGTRDSFSDLGQTAAEYLGIGPLKNGKSFLTLIKE